MSPASNGDERSLGELFSAATTELSALVHDEIALAKTEIRQDVKRATIGSGALIVALALCLFAVPMGCMALAYVIHRTGLPLDASFGIVCGAFVVLGVLLAALAYSRFKKVKKPERSIASAKETAAVLQKAKPRPRELGPQDAKPLGATVAAPALESKM
ncbi:phage holin family protein [Streptomyces sp. NBC_00448]|uniref:phage holin family protein n=1 Tax=Streptomyces sp. NBC_00448 TaxID=2903652 RepID=UPI002E1F855D